MPAWTSALLIAVMGVATLTGMAFAPDEQTRMVAAFVPPWAAGGLAASGLAVVDLRWRGYVMILDTGGDGTALARLRAQGYWLMDATGVRGCAEGIVR